MEQLYYLPSASCAGFLIPSPLVPGHYTLGCFFQPVERTLVFASKLAIGHPSRDNPDQIKLPPAPYLFLLRIEIDEGGAGAGLSLASPQLFQYAFDSDHNLQLAPAFCPNIAPENGRMCFSAVTNYYCSPRTLLNTFWSGFFTESMVSTFSDLERSALSGSEFYKAYLSRFQQPPPTPKFQSASAFGVVFNDQTVSWIGSPDALYFNPGTRRLLPAEQVSGRWLAAQQPLPETLVAV